MRYWFIVLALFFFFAPSANAADLFALPTGAGSQNGTSLANACNSSNDSDCGTNAPSGSVVYLCDTGAGFSQSSSWANANTGNVRWTGDCSAFGYAERATIRNTGGAYNLNWTGTGNGTFENIDFVGGGNSDCVNASSTGALSFNNITISGCSGDGLDIDRLNGGLTYNYLTIEDVPLNGLFCTNGRVVGTNFIGRRVGTAGANNYDTIGIDDDCGAGSLLVGGYIEDQRGDLGGAIDLQDSTGTGQLTIVSGFYIDTCEGSGITAVTNTGLGTQTFRSTVVDNCKFGVYLKDTGGIHEVYNITTVNSPNTELKLGDSGTSGDAINSIRIYNSIFGGAQCDPSAVAIYWRNNASVSVTGNNNNYCPGGVFQLASGGDVSFSTWQSSSGADSRSTQIDPQLKGGIAQTRLDSLRLTGTSTLTNGGVHIGNYTDITGKPFEYTPSIGAFQFGARDFIRNRIAR